MTGPSEKAGWRERLARLFGRTRRPQGEPAVFMELRSMALDLDPDALDIPEGSRWRGAAVAVMEIGVPNGSATVVAVADGSVSLYLSSGGGTIGAGAHAAVAAAATHFREVLGESRGLLTAVEAFPPPPTSGEVRFHARIGDARYTGSAPQTALRSGRHPLGESYAAGQDVLTEIRLASEAVGA